MSQFFSKGTAGAAADATTLTGDAGGVVNGDVSGNIDLIGGASQGYISTTGTPASNLMELFLTEPASDGELLIGNTAVGGPSVGNLTAGSGVSIVNGNGSITISATIGSALMMPTDSGTATASGGEIDVLGGAGIATSASGNTVTITANAATPLQFPTDAGTAVPAGNSLTILGGTGLSTSASGSTVTVVLNTPVSVANGGTGATSLTDGGILLGSGTAAITATAQPTNGQLLIGSTGVDPVLASLTAPAAGLTISSGAGSVTFALADDLAALEAIATTGMMARTASNTYATRTITAGTGITVSNGDGIAGNPTITLQTPVTVANGGTGATSLADGHVLLGSGTGAVTALDVTAKGSLLVGDGTTDPQALAVGTDTYVLTADSAEGVGMKWAAAGSGSGSGLKFIESQTASGDTSLDFATGIDSTYNCYMFELDHVASTDDIVQLYIRTSTNGGSSYDSSASDYFYAFTTVGSSGVQDGYDAADSEIKIAGVGGATPYRMGNGTQESLSGQVFLHNPAGTNYFHATWDLFFIDYQGNPVHVTGGGARLSAADVDAVRFLISSGTIASGTITLYGVTTPS